MTDNQFDKFKNLIAKKVGIDSLVSRKYFVEMDLGLELLSELEMNFDEIMDSLSILPSEDSLWQNYLKKLCNPETFFFRENRQFDSILKVIPRFERELKIWSAPCSSGEEVYSLAMFLLEKRINKFTIFGSDIRTDMLKCAREAIYNSKHNPNRFTYIKQNYMHYFRNNDPDGIIRIIDEVKNKVSFSYVNLLDHSTYPLNNFDIIFCRNLFIYLDEQNKEKLVSSLWRKIIPGGCLCLGTSDYISKYFSKLDGLDESTGDSIYRKIR